MSEYLNEKTFVVSYISFFDNYLHSEIVKALHTYHALELSSVVKNGYLSLEDLHLITDMEELKYAAFDRDFMFEVIEVDN